jgi:uncharacterized protein YoxC
MDPRILHGIIKPMVIDPIKNDVETIFGEIEQNLQMVAKILSQMKENKSNAVLTLKLSEESEPLLLKVSALSDDISKKLKNIQNTWFDAANL